MKVSHALLFLIFFKPYCSFANVHHDDYIYINNATGDPLIGKYHTYYSDFGGGNSNKTSGNITIAPNSTLQINYGMEFTSGENPASDIYLSHNCTIHFQGSGNTGIDYLALTETSGCNGYYTINGLGTVMVPSDDGRNLFSIGIQLDKANNNARINLAVGLGSVSVSDQQGNFIPLVKNSNKWLFNMDYIKSQDYQLVFHFSNTNEICTFIHPGQASIDEQNNSGDISNMTNHSDSIQCGKSVYGAFQKADDNYNFTFICQQQANAESPCPWAKKLASNIQVPVYGY